MPAKATKRTEDWRERLADIIGHDTKGAWGTALLYPGKRSSIKNYKGGKPTTRADIDVIMKVLEKNRQNRGEVAKERMASLPSKQKLKGLFGGGQ